MKCEDAEKLIIDYLDGKLSSELSSELELHLASCEKCLDEVKETKDLFSLMSGTPVEKPGESLKINFYHMLHGEMIKSASAITRPFAGRKANRKIAWYSIAAGLVMLLAGTFIGILLGKGIAGSGNKEELSLMKAEISELKKTTMMTMLQQESSSGRIMAVSYAEEMDTPDQNVIDVLFKTLNTDHNVNVRMAAAYALGKLTDKRSVCDSLVVSLSSQTDPVVQVTLINILAERRVRNALVPVQKIISNKSTMNEVKVIAKNSLHYFI